MRILKVQAALLFLLFSTSLVGQDLDIRLAQIIDIYQLEALNCSAHQNNSELLADAGKLIFETTALSGGNDSGCSTCHLDTKNLTDGLPISVGVGGVGEGLDRMQSGVGVLVPRNSFSLFGRGHQLYSSYFWDGKVELQDDGILISPFGEEVSQSFDSLLSVAAILPLLARDEFLGVMGGSNQPHNLDINEYHYQERYEAASELYRQLIFEGVSPELSRIKDGLVTAGISKSDFELADLGNAIAAFVIRDFSCPESAWNDYLIGDRSSLSAEQKSGAVVFFGKGRCAACHQGPLFSDFDFHSIGIPQGGFGMGTLGQDLGRSEVSLRAEDRYKFKTPPLLLVSKTAPYGHNGMFSDLEDVVIHHTNPVAMFKNYTWSDDFEYLNYGKILSSRDELLSYIDILNTDEINDLVEFLRAL